MKIGFDAKRALNNHSGLGNYSRNLLNGLLEHFPDNDYFLFSPKADEVLFHQISDNFKPVFPDNKFSKSFHPLWRSFGIKKQLQEKRVEIYHGLSNEIPYGVHQLGIGLVVTIHDLIFLKHKVQYPFIDRSIYELKTRYAAKHADKIIAVSEETKYDLIEFYKIPERKIDVVYPLSVVSSQLSVVGCQLSDEKRIGIDEKYSLPTKYILDVGSFFPRKNQSILIEAFDRIKNEVEEDLVLVGGNGTMLSEIKQKVAEKKLDNRVHILTGVSNDELTTIYKASSVFVFPSLLEGFGMPIVEALLSKVPVIASKGGAIEEAAGKDSLFVDPNSAEDIAEKILLVLKDEALRKNMIEAGIVHAQTMSSKILTEKVMKVYLSV
jgi:glycosyltransferase involved in cell wall biosynthesis